MAEPSTPHQPAPSISPEALRIVLFGMPDAGKTSLLGALAQAAQSQEHLLNGHLSDVSHGLAELQHRLYEEHPRETLEEVVPYPVAFEPFLSTGQHLPGQGFVLVDCDGRVANELLARRRSLTADSAEGSLAEAILEADALILVVDASASPTQVEADFGEFARFLKTLEQSRGRYAQVGGLPIFLVLTKCDLLAQPADTPSTWVQRIDERKRHVESRFREFIEQPAEAEPVPFGSVDLHPWATAVKHPPLAGAPAKPREPYGVAELFRQSFDEAQRYRQRRVRAGRRLLWTVTGSLGAVGVMATMVAVLIGGSRQEEPAVRRLLAGVDSYRAREAQAPSLRLREPLQTKISELTDLQNDPAFARLSEEQRSYVQTRLRELQEYKAYREKLLRLPSISAVRNEQELDALEKSLKNLAPPGDHQSDWSQTEAALLRAQRLEDCKVLRAAVVDLEDWYNRLSRRGRDLGSFSQYGETSPVSWPDWHNQVQALLDEAGRPPHQPAEKLPGSNVTYELATRFEKVGAAHNAWEGVKQRLVRVRDLSLALGLAGPVAGRSPLDIPADFGVSQSASRLQELEKAYPRFREELTQADLPEAIAGAVRRAARTRYEHVLKGGREVVVKHLQEATQGDRELAESWQRIRPWLNNPDELRAWRVLATVLARLQSSDGADPVSVLESFLRLERFDLVMRLIRLEIPDNLKVRPAGKFTIHHRGANDPGTSLTYELTGVERHDPRRGTTAYSFRPLGGVTIVYKPGDTLWADVPVRRGEQPEWFLTWARNRSRIYQFERLEQPPRLHRGDQENTEGDLAEGVLLEISPEGGVPKVPDLIPIVPIKLEQR